MANVCITNYVCVGNSADIHDFFRLLTMLSAQDNDGCKLRQVAVLIQRLGGDPMDYDCRGEWVNCSLISDTRMDFDVTSAWCEIAGLRKLIEQRYKSIKIFFWSEEPCCDVFETNDVDCIYFDGHYVLTLGEEIICFRSKSDAMTYLRRLLNEISVTDNNVDELLSYWGEENGLEYVSYHEYEVVK